MILKEIRGSESYLSSLKTRSASTAKVRTRSGQVQPSEYSSDMTVPPNIVTWALIFRSADLYRWINGRQGNSRSWSLGVINKAHAFYAKNNMFADGRPNHEDPALAKYKMALSKQALESIEGESKGKKTVETTSSGPEIVKEETKMEEAFFEADMNPTPATSKVATGGNPSSSSIYSFTNVKHGNQPANLNAKKLDVAFEDDGFFDSFGVANQAPKPAKSGNNDNPFALAEASDESGPFQLGAGVKAPAKERDNDEFVKQKLKELQGKKGISSEDFKQLHEDEDKERLKRFSGATAISSADFFGEPKKENDSQGRSSLSSFGRDSFGDKVSEAAIYAADTVAQNAKKLKDKASNFWSSFGRPSE